MKKWKYLSQNSRQKKCASIYWHIGFLNSIYPSNRIDGALEHEPGRHVPLPDIEHGLARGEVAGRTAGEAFRRLDLGLIQNREDLFAAGLGDAHDNSPCLPALLLARRRGKRGMEVAVESRTAVRRAKIRLRRRGSGSPAPIAGPPSRFPSGRRRSLKTACPQRRRSRTRSPSGHTPATPKGSRQAGSCIRDCCERCASNRHS